MHRKLTITVGLCLKTDGKVEDGVRAEIVGPSYAHMGPGTQRCKMRLAGVRAGAPARAALGPVMSMLEPRCNPRRIRKSLPAP